MSFNLTDIMGSSIKYTEAIKQNTDYIANAMAAITTSLGIQIEEQRKANEINDRNNKIQFSKIFEKFKNNNTKKSDPLLSISSNVEKIAKSITKSSKEKSAKSGKLKNASAEVELISELGKVMLIFAKVGKKTELINKAGETIKNTLIKIFDAFDNESIKKIDMKRVQQSAIALKNIGNSVWSFTKDLTKTLLLAVPAMLGWVLIKGVVSSAMKLFIKLSDGKDMKNVKQGTISLNIMSAGLLAFTTSLALSTLIVAGMGLGGKEMGEAVLGALGVFALAFGTFYLFTKVLGKTKNVKNALTGSLALSIMSAGLLTFALAMKSTSILTWPDIGMGSALLGIGALAITIIGAIGLISGGALYGFAILGSVALAAMSASLLLFGLTIKALSAIKIEPDSLDGFFESALSLTKTFVMLSAGALVALPAAISMLTIASSAILVCTALNILSNMKIFNDGGKKLKEKMTNFSIALTNLKGAFLGEEPKEKGFWGKLGGAVTGLVGGTVDMIRAIEASVMFLSLSTSAVGIAKALEKLSEFDTNKISEGSKGLNLVLSELSKTFSEDDNKELFKTLGRAIIGVKSFEMLGAGISNMATGIALFAELESNGIPQYDSNGKQTGRFTKVNYAKITDSIVNIAKSLANAFNDPIFTDVTTISCDGFWGAIGGKKVVPKFAAALESFGSLGVVMDGLTKMVNTFGGDIDSEKVKAGIQATFGSIKEIFSEENSGWMKGLDKKFKQWKNFNYITEPLVSLNGIDLTKSGLDSLSSVGETINNTKVENINAAAFLADKVSKLKDLKTDKLEKMFEKMLQASEKMIEMLDKSNTLTENLANAAENNSSSSSSNSSMFDKVKDRISGDKGDKGNSAAVVPQASSPEPQEIRIYLNDIEGTNFRISTDF